MPEIVFSYQNLVVSFLINENLCKMLKKLFVIVLILGTFAVSAKAEEAVFVPSLPDVPLPKGFEVDPTTGSFFDTAEGRIVDMYAMGYEDQGFIEDFYEDVMGQFGWQSIGGMNFVKEGEVLSIIFEKGQKEINTVKYQLRPNRR